MRLLTHNEFSLTLPPGWEDGSHIIARGPPQPDFQASVVLVLEPYGARETLDDIAARYLKGLSGLPSFALSKQAHHKIGPFSGYLRDYTFSTPNGLALAQVQFSFIHGKRVCTLTYSDTRERMPKTRSAGLDIFASLQLRAATSDDFEA